VHEDVGEVRADLEGGRVELEHTIELRVVPQTYDRVSYGDG